MFNCIRKYVALALFGSLSACAVSNDVLGETVEAETVLSTQKPGALVSFSSESPTNLQISENGLVKIKVTDGYDSGRLLLSATPDDGLRLVSETGQVEFSMAGSQAHEWELDVTASANGIYYLNILAKAVLPTGRSELRSYAVRVQVGDLTEAEIKSSMKPNGTLSSDGTIVVMDAEEEIK